MGAVIVRERTFRGVELQTGAPVSDADWEHAVGSRIAARAKPTSLSRGVLLVTTATAAWSNELSLLCEPILANLRRGGLDVRELRFRVGPIDTPQKNSTRRPAKLVPRPVTLDGPLARSLERVEDDDLRSAIEAAARQSLAYSAKR